MAENPPPIRDDTAETACRHAETELEARQQRDRHALATQEKTAQQNENALVAQVKACLLSIVEESRQIHAAEHDQAAAVLERKQRQLEGIRRLLEERFGSSVDPRVVEIRQALTALMGTLTQKQAEMQRELTAANQQKTLEMQRIATEAEDKRRALEKQHAANIRQEFSTMLEKLHHEQQKAKDALASSIERERQVFYEMLHGAKSRHQTLRNLLQQEVHSSRLMVKEKMEICHRIIRTGDVATAVATQKELIQFLRQRHHLFAEETHAVSLANLEALSQFDTTIQLDNRAWAEQSRQLFQQVEALVEQGANQQSEAIEQALTEEITALLNNHR